MRIFLGLILAYTMSMFYRSFLTVIAVPLQRDLGLGPAEFGFLGSIWFIVFAAMQFAVGFALDRYGPRRTTFVLMLLGCVGGVLFATATSYATALVGMGLIGVGCSPVFMSALYLFARTSTAGQFGMLTSIFITIGSVGNLMGTAPLALAVTEFGWRNAMLGIAALFALGTLVAGTVLRDPPRATGGAEGDDGIWQGLKAILAIRPLWLIAPITLFSYAILVTSRGLWIVPFLSNVHGLDAVASGHGALAMAVAMMAGAVLYGVLERRLGQQKALVLAGTSIMMVAYAVLALAGHVSALAAITLFALIGCGGFTYAIIMAHARYFFPAHLIGRGMTAMNFLFIAGAALVQAGSGRFIAAQTAQGVSAAQTYANLHLIFASILIGAIAVYAFAPARPLDTKTG
jgi:sugar phosphate permease